jgi:hypothetical protein
VIPSVPHVPSLGSQPIGHVFGRHVPPPQSRVHTHSPLVHEHDDGRQLPPLVEISQT